MRGFSLVEIIVTLAIFTVLVSFGLFMGVQTISTAIHRSEEATIVSLLEKARSRAINNMYQTTWSVCYVSPNYIVAKGSTCSLATAYDKVAADSRVATASDFTNPAKFPTIVFDQLTGDVPSSVSIDVVQDNTKTITINHEGAIIW
jgi:prepilin-type N-terminal cleavage/methylation domain-containing protein